MDEPRETDGRSSGEKVALEVRDLSVAFGNRRVLNRVNIDLKAERILAIVGPSGCGKSTLLHSIAGLLPFISEAQLSGRVFVDGCDITALPPERRPVSLLFQGYALFPHMTVAENVLFGPRMRGVAPSIAEKRLRHLLSIVELDDWANAYPRQLSGGMQQRVALARALATEPRILLLDEPLSALDRLLQLELEEHIRRWLRKVGTTAIFVTHDHQQALAIGDCITILGRDGAVLQTGTPGDVYRTPASARVAGSLGDANLLPSTVLSIDDAATATLRVGSTAVRCRIGSATLAVGQSALLLLRPEAIAITKDDDPPHLSRISARVVSCMYRGDHLLVRASMPDVGTDFTARLSTTTGALEANTSIHFTVFDAVALPDEAASL